MARRRSRSWKATLQARTSVAQLRTLGRAFDAARAVGGLVVDWWRRFERWLQTNPAPWQARTGAERFFAELQQIVRQEIGGQLGAAAHAAYVDVRAALASSLPLDVLQTVRPVLEDKSRRKPPPPDDDAERRYREMLFPPPSEEKVREVLRRPIAGSSWEQELSSASRLAGFDPLRMVNEISIGFSAGETPQQIAARAKPAVDGVDSSARRIARTYAMQVSHAGGMEAYAALGDLVIGYEIHAQLDQNTRPWHAARSGTIYYRNPTGDQKGLAQMPSPPLEAPDSSERPPGTPATAWNCRCWLSPVLATETEPATGPTAASASAAAQPPIEPDQGVYSDWFAQAGERERQLAVGVRRYNETKAKLRRPPKWEDFQKPKAPPPDQPPKWDGTIDQGSVDRVGVVQVIAQITEDKLNRAITDTVNLVRGIHTDAASGTTATVWRWEATDGEGDWTLNQSQALADGNLHATTLASRAEIREVSRQVAEKIKNAPVPSSADVRKAKVELAKARRGEGRAGGESRGGSAASRRKQRENLFTEFGGDEKGYVVCSETGIKMHWTDDPEINPKGYPKFERGKIFIKAQGGGYQLANLIPESFAVNRARNDKMVRKENAK